jgi:hypothetical protein
MQIGSAPRRRSSVEHVQQLRTPPLPACCPTRYLGEVDFFGVYCVETGGVYLIPIGDALLRREGALRVDPPKNNQRKFIRYAAQYEIGRVDIHAPNRLNSG